MLDRIERRITLVGELSAEQRQRLLDRKPLSGTQVADFEDRHPDRIGQPVLVSDNEFRNITAGKSGSGLRQCDLVFLQQLQCGDMPYLV